MKRASCAALACSIAFALAGSARAQEGPPPPPVPPSAPVAAPVDLWSDTFAVEAHLGLGQTTYTPFGSVGAALDYTPWSWLSLTAGAGKIYHGWEDGFMMRLRFTFADSWGVGVGLGASTSKADGTEKQWSNGELFLEYRLPSIFVRGYVGTANQQNPAQQGGATPVTAPPCTAPGCATPPPQPTAMTKIPYAGIALGIPF